MGSIECRVPSDECPVVSAEGVFGDVGDGLAGATQKQVFVFLFVRRSVGVGAARAFVPDAELGVG